MKKTLLPICFCLFFLLSTVLGQNNKEPFDNNDPDLPAFLQNGIDKAAYLQARENYINMKRGLPWDLPYNPRLKAINDSRKIIKLIGNNSTPQGILEGQGLLSAPIPHWKELGPSPIPNGQTFNVQFSTSGRVTAIAIHPGNPNIVYVGTANGGVYRTLNGGSSWSSIFDNASSLAIGALALAPSNPSILFVGTGEANGSADSYTGIGIYRVENADAIPILFGPINPVPGGGGNPCFNGRSISKILVDPNNPDTIFVSTATGVVGNPGSPPGAPLGALGLYRSTNATAAAASVAFKKIAVSNASRSITDMVMEPGNPNNLICWVNGGAAARQGGIYRSTTALSATPSFPLNQQFTTTLSNARASLAINKTGGITTIYAATEESAAGTGCTSGSGCLRTSTDGGITWSAKLTGGGGFCGGQCFYDIAIDVDPTNANNILLGGAANGTCSRIVQRSTDGATTFSTNQNGLHADCHVIAIAPSNPNIVYSGNDGGIFKSTDAGQTWNSLNVTGFNATQFQSLAIHPTDVNFTIGGTQDNGTNMIKPDASFNRIDFGDGGYSAIDQNATDVTNVTMYHTYYNLAGSLIGYVRVTSVANAFDGGWSFLGCPNGVNSFNGIGCTDNTLFYAPLVLGPGNPNTVYFGTDRLYRSTNRGTNNTVVSQAPINGNSISSIAIAKQDDNVRIVGLEDGTLWATSAGSSTLTLITPAGAPTKAVGNIAIDPNDKNTAYVCYTGYIGSAGKRIFKTNNLATTDPPTPVWRDISGTVPDVPVNAIAIDPKNSLSVYIGTDIGVFASADSGSTWSNFSTGLPIVPIFDMAVHPVSRNLKIATHGRGIWETVTWPVQFVFNGNGNWNIASNWLYGYVPPSVLPAGYEIIIDPIVGGECDLNVPQTISIGATFTLKKGKKFVARNNLIFRH